MVLNLLRIRNLRWNLRRRSPFIRVKLLQDLHALLAQNLFGGHVLASTSGQIKWCVWYHRISTQTTWLNYILTEFHLTFVFALDQMVCSDKTLFSCENLCGNPLPCGNHFCTKTCHPLKNQTVPSVRQARSEPCEKCQLPCKKVLLIPSYWTALMIHFRILHLPWKLIFTLVLLKLLSLTFFGTFETKCCMIAENVFIQEREPACPHPCPLPCHPGECPPCKVLVKRSCHCGSMVHVFECIYFNILSEKEQMAARSCKGPCHR